MAEIIIILTLLGSNLNQILANKFLLFNFTALRHRDRNARTYKRLLQLTLKHPLDLASKHTVAIPLEAADHVAFFACA